MEIAIAILALLVIIGVIAVAALVFGGWLIIATVRLVGRVLGMGSRQSVQGRRHAPRLAATPAARRTRCAHPKCRADNPEDARFCRRCGNVIRLPRAQPVARRVAMW